MPDWVSKGKLQELAW